MNIITNERQLDPYLAKILVVDDEAPNVKLLEELLKMTGYKNVTCTQEPTDVLELFKQHKFDLILLDLNMPVMNGYEVMKQLKIYTDDNLPAIIMLTAQHIKSYIHRALNEGARDYITKPFKFKELLSTLHSILVIEIAHKYMALQESQAKC